MEEEKNIIAEKHTKNVNGAEILSELVVSWNTEQFSSIGPAYLGRKKEEIFRLHINYLNELIEILTDLKKLN